MGILDWADKNKMMAMGILQSLPMLTAKTRKSFDAAQQRANAGILGMYDVEKESDKREQLKTLMNDMQGGMDNGLLASRLMGIPGMESEAVGLLKDQYKSQQDGKYANQPFYAIDPKTMQVKAFQLNNVGVPREIPLPEGFNPAVRMSPVDVGGTIQPFSQFGGFPSVQQTPNAPITKTVPPEQTPEHKAKVKAAEAEAAANAQKTSEAPKELEQATNMLTTIRTLKDHPGRELMTGGSSAIGNLVAVAPGTDARDFKELLGQIEGQKFLAAYQQLKGGGQITEVEGKEAKTAISNLQTAQSEEQFLSALETLENMLVKAQKKAEQQLGISKRRRFNPATGKLE